MTWLLIVGAVLVAGLAIVAAFGIGFTKGAAATWTGVQRLNAARATAQTSALPETPETPEDLETRAMLRVTWALSPLSREAAIRVVYAANQRFVVAPAIEAEKEQERIKEERVRERQLLFVAGQAQQEKAS